MAFTSQVPAKCDMGVRDSERREIKHVANLCGCYFGFAMTLSKALLTFSAKHSLCCISASKPLPTFLFAYFRFHPHPNQNDSEPNLYEVSNAKCSM